MKKVKYMDQADFIELGEILNRISEHSATIANAHKDFNRGMMSFYSELHKCEDLFAKCFIEDSNES